MGKVSNPLTNLATDELHKLIQHRLEATFGVIAAAAASVRPLFGRNAHSMDNTARSMPSIPLQSNCKSHNPGRAWYRGMDPEQGDFQNLKEYPGPALDDTTDKSSESGSSQGKIWPMTDGRIVKTTDVRVSRDSQALDMAGHSLQDSDNNDHGMELCIPKVPHM